MCHKEVDIFEPVEIVNEERNVTALIADIGETMLIAVYAIQCMP